MWEFTRFSSGWEQIAIPECLHSKRNPVKASFKICIFRFLSDPWICSVVDAFSVLLDPSPFITLRVEWWLGAAPSNPAVVPGLRIWSKQGIEQHL